MVGLGFLPGGNYSRATGVNADGSVVVGGGHSTNSGGVNSEAFRWSSSGGMVGLGLLPGGTYSAANAVNANGSVIVGYGNSTNAGGNSEAFRWTAFTGMRSIRDLLVASGVDMTEWSLTTATGVSADGTVMVGYGPSPSGIAEAWLVRCSTGCGIITPGVVPQSFSGQSAMGQTGNAALPPLPARSA